MTSNEHSEFVRSAFDRCDPQYLRTLREQSGMDLLVLARTACLSVAQIRQLENPSGGTLFYSDAIRRQAYKRLLIILGVEPPLVVDGVVSLQQHEQSTQANLNTLDQIVAMSYLPAMTRPTAAVLRDQLLKLVSHKQALGSLLLLVVAVVVFALNVPQNVLEAVAAVDKQVSSVKVQQPVSVTLATVAAPAAAYTSNACAFSNEALPELSPATARKAGSYVYVVSNSDTQLCLVDGNKQATVVDLKVGESRSIFGSPPWQVSAANLQKVQIYFQGVHVVPTDVAVNRVKLVEVPVAR